MKTKLSKNKKTLTKHIQHEYNTYVVCGLHMKGDLHMKKIYENGKVYAGNSDDVFLFEIRNKTNFKQKVFSKNFEKCVDK